MLVVLSAHLAVLGGLLLQQQWHGGGFFGAVISDPPLAPVSAIASKVEAPPLSTSDSAYAAPVPASAPALAKPAPLSAPMPLKPSPPAVGSVVHTDSPQQITEYLVRPGDSLIRISKAHGTTVKAVRSLNHLDSDRLWVGQKLHIPPSASASVP
jgi:LysM repeat protein